MDEKLLPAGVGDRAGDAVSVADCVLFSVVNSASGDIVMSELDDHKVTLLDRVYESGEPDMHLQGEHEEYE